MTTPVHATGHRRRRSPPRRSVRQEDPRLDPTGPACAHTAAKRLRNLTGPGSRGGRLEHQRIGARCRRRADRGSELVGASGRMSSSLMTTTLTYAKVRLDETHCLRPRAHRGSLTPSSRAISPGLGLGHGARRRACALFRTPICGRWAWRMVIQGPLGRITSPACPVSAPTPRPRSWAPPTGCVGLARAAQPGSDKQLQLVWPWPLTPSPRAARDVVAARGGS